VSVSAPLDIRHSVRILIGHDAGVTAPGQPDGEGVHAWTNADRQAQLTEFSRLCAALADGFAVHDPLAAAEFRERADLADFLASEWLHAAGPQPVGGSVPRWRVVAEPKALDFDAPGDRGRTGWPIFTNEPTWWPLISPPWRSTGTRPIRA
jgi:hypothetical protein